MEGLHSLHLNADDFFFPRLSPNGLIKEKEECNFPARERMSTNYSDIHNTRFKKTKHVAPFISKLQYNIVTFYVSFLTT